MIFNLTKVISKYSKLELDAYADAGAIAEEVLGSIKTVISFNGQKEELKDWWNLFNSMSEMIEHKLADLDSNAPCSFLPGQALCACWITNAVKAERCCFQTVDQILILFFFWNHTYQIKNVLIIFANDILNIVDYNLVIFNS